LKPYKVGGRLDGHLKESKLMDKSLQRAWLRDKHKRIANCKRNARNTLNWPFHKQVALTVFDELNRHARLDNDFLHIMRQAGKPAFSGDWGSFYYGEDNICLSFKDRYTGRRAELVTREGSKEQSNEREHGASLVIYYSEHSGYFQVFFAPPYFENYAHGDEATATQIRKEILVTYRTNMDDLTRAFVKRMVRRFFIYARVESSLETNSWFEAMRVRWWRFMDVRNRQAMKGEIDGVFSLWEKLGGSALIALVSFIFGVLTHPLIKTK